MKPAKRNRNRKVGRPSKYSRTVILTICSAIADGTPFSYAAALGGISYETFCQWRKQYSEFSDAIDKAKASGILARLQLINDAAKKGDVAAARWWLEHVVPEHFAKSRIEHRHDVSGEIGHSLAIDPAVLDAIADARKRHESN